MKKQTIILIHGFRGTHHGLALIADHLKEYDTIVPDLPGFGEGDQLETHDLDSYVQWLKAFIENQNLVSPPVLLGHSFGSIISAAYAKKYPKTISKLILVNPIGAPALEGPKAVMSKLAVFYYWVGTKLPHSFAQKWLASNLIVMVMSVTMAKTKDKKLRAFIHDQHRQYFSLFHTSKSVAEGFSTSVNHSVRDFAKDIKTPTLLIAGAQDDITPVQKQKELQKLFPNAELEIIQHVGHLTHYETPDQVAASIQAFIRSL
ncbi:MAG: hydrolase [Candidatus Saccharibacteria bacterium]|nr:hydrolase [Candidatus Saccharibacteria bacterium]